ncbi:MAG TPA: hypothetical protein VNO14_16155 [Blastocatellia bacterium]|nr:hypothetical protein [Blastocatellia bacterium]
MMAAELVALVIGHSETGVAEQSFNLSFERCPLAHEYHLDGAMLVRFSFR